jgi:hypothetical protein
LMLFNAGPARFRGGFSPREYLSMSPRRKKTSNQGQKSLACWE